MEAKKLDEAHQQEIKAHQQIAEAHEKGQNDFQKAIDQNEKHLMKLFQNHIQKMEREERGVLKGVNAFVAKAQKGSP